ncbi:MAG: ATP-binding cassette domain-containing protein [Puniceicoccaceae bacterium]|nr:MAG: ATP-binding cassette domain-containing protein [Puniceicoccaceae bacterium]
MTDKNTGAVGLEVSGLSKSYGETEVLHDISFQVEPGEVFVIMGPSGSGKSVLLKHLIGLEQPTAGEVLIDGRAVTDPATLRTIHAALVFQAGALFNSMSVYDNLALYPREHRILPEKGIRDRIGEILRILSLENAAERFPAELSGGMRKRVAIARALVMEPQIIFYDEPTSELDPIMAATISEIIACLKEQIDVTSIVVSHDRDLSLTIADRIAILMDGRLRVIATPDKLKATDDAAVADFLNPAIDLKNPRFKQRSA